MNKSLLSFLNNFKEEMNKTGIDVSGLNMDHVAYQAESTQDYEERKEAFKEYGDLTHEATVGGRRVAVFGLDEPLQYSDNTIIAYEVIEPKEGQQVASGWEHVEYVLQKPYEDFMSRYPELDWDSSSLDRYVYSHLKLKLTDTMQVKFHQHDILETIAVEMASK